MRQRRDYYKPVPKRDVIPLTDVQRELAEAYIPLARNLAKPLKVMFPQWRDEFESASLMALVEAARNFDPSRKIRFATFARFRIRGALADVGRVMGMKGWEGDHEDAPSLVALTPYNEEHGRVLVAHEPDEVGTETDDADAVEGWLRKLPKVNAHVCRRLYLYGETQAEIAANMGLSPSEVSRIYRFAIKLLTPAFDDHGQPIVSGRRRRQRKVRPCSACDSVTIPA